MASEVYVSPSLYFPFNWIITSHHISIVPANIFSFQWYWKVIFVLIMFVCQGHLLVRLDKDWLTHIFFSWFHSYSRPWPTKLVCLFKFRVVVFPPPSLCAFMIWKVLGDYFFNQLWDFFENQNYSQNNFTFEEYNIR